MRSVLAVGALILLGPLLALQGMWVRARTPKLPEPPGLRAGDNQTDSDWSLLVLGDSAAAGVGANSQEQALLGQILENLGADQLSHWRLEAQTGLTTQGALELADKLPPRAYLHSVVMLGVNDITSLITSKTWIAQQHQLHRLLHSKLRLEHLFVCQPPPMHGFPALPQPLRWYLGMRAEIFSARLAQALESKPETSLIRFDFSAETDAMASDGFHPGPQLYRAMGRGIAARLKERHPEPSMRSSQFDPSAS